MQTLVATMQTLVALALPVVRGQLEPLSPPVYQLEAATKNVTWPAGARSISQSREDAALYYTYFARNPAYRGTFVEIGALDGHKYSDDPHGIRSARGGDS